MNEGERIKLSFLVLQAVGSDLVWEDFNNKNTIEHIYPQSAAKSFDEYSEIGPT